MRPRRFVVPALAAAMTLLVGGCGGNDTPTDEPTGASSPVTTGPSATVSAEPSESASAGSTGLPGRVQVTAGLPAGFPSEDIPLLDAKILIGQPGEPGGPVAWSIVMLPKGDIGDIAEEAGAKLKGAGFKAGQKTSVDNLEVRSYENADYEVGITVAKTPEGNTLTYVVRKAS